MFVLSRLNKSIDRSNERTLSPAADLSVLLLLVVVVVVLVLLLLFVRLYIACFQHCKCQLGSSTFTAIDQSLCEATSTTLSCR